MTIPSPLVLVNSQSQLPNGVNVPDGSTVTVALASTDGVYAWELECIGTDDLNTAAAVNATLVINHANFTATFTAPHSPDGYGCALIFRSTVNSGVDINGLKQPYLTTTCGIYVEAFVNGIRVGAQNETSEGNATYGWLTKFNQAVRNGLFTGGTLFGDVTGPAPSNTVSKLQGNPLNVSSPTTGYVITWDGAEWVPAAATSPTMAGDVTGTTLTSKVVALQNNPITNAAPANGQVLTWDSVDGYWRPQNITSGSVTLAGDVTGAAGANTVTAIYGNPVANTGHLGSTQDGYVLTWDNADGYYKALLPAGFAIKTVGGDLVDGDRIGGTWQRTHQYVKTISGPDEDLATGDSGGAPVEVYARGFTFGQHVWWPRILQEPGGSISDGSGYSLTIQSQQSGNTSVSGGDLLLSSGSGGTPTHDGLAGTLSGHVRIAIGGVNSSSNDKIPPYQVPTHNLIGDVKIDASLNKVSIFGPTEIDTLKVLDLSNGLVFSNSSGQLFTSSLGGDLSYIGTNGYVASISGATGAGGNVIVNSSGFIWASGVATPTISQSAVTANNVSATSLNINAQTISATPTSGTAGTGGALNLTSGAGGAAGGGATPGPGGAINITAGAGGNGTGTSATGGAINITGGASNRNPGGAVTISGGANTTSSTGGMVTVTGGAGAVGGDVRVTGGDKGGNVYISTGRSNPTAGSILFQVGNTDLTTYTTKMSIDHTGQVNIVNLGGSGAGFVTTDNSGNLGFASGAPPSGAAGGDLAGTYPNPSVAAIRGNPVQNVVPSDAQVLTWDSSGGMWEPKAIPAITLAGDVTGPTGSNTVTKLQNRLVSSVAPNTGDTLYWDSTQWAPTGLIGDTQGHINANIVTAIQGNAVASGLLGSGQNGYILTWVNASNHWAAQAPVSGITWANDLSTSTDTSQNVVTISGTGVSGTVMINTRISGLNDSISSTYRPLKYARFAIGFVGDTDFTLSGQALSYPILQFQGGVTLSATRTVTLPLTDGAQYEIYNNHTTGISLTFKGATGTGVTIPYGFAAIIYTDGTNWYPLTIFPGGDLTGTNTSQTVVAAQGNAIKAETLGSANDGYVMMWDNGGPFWRSAKYAGDVTGEPTASVVAKINGTTISTAGGSLTTGKVLRVTGSSTADWGAVDLANSSAVTGILPIGNQAVQSLVGDASGTTAAVSVDKIKGNAVKSETLDATTDGYVLMWKNSASNWQSAKYAGDVTGSPIASTVVNIQGRAVKNASPSDGQVLTWVAANSDWEPLTPGATVTFGGDLTGSSTTQTVIKINGASVPAAGSLTTGNVLQVSGSSALTYGAVNLAGGSNYVTGVLPTANQANQSMGGDVTGTTNSNTVQTVSGTGTSGSVEFNTGIKGATSNPYKFTPVTISMGDANYSINTTEYGYPVLNVTAGAALTADRTVTLPLTAGAQYEVYNGKTSPFNLQFKGATGTGVTVPYGGRAIIYCDGTNWYPLTFLAGGDLTGNLTSQTVSQVRGAQVATAGGSLTQYKVLQVSGAAQIDYDAVHLDQAAAVTGVLPRGNQQAQNLSGDLSGTTAAATVIKLQGVSVSTTTPTDQYVLQYNGGTSKWEPATPPGGPPTGSAGGDLSGTYPNPTIVGLALSKLANGSSGQIIVQNGTPTWTTMSGDVSIGNTGVTTVNAISGPTPIAVTPNEIQWIGGAATPTIDQAQRSGTGANAGVQFTLKAQKGQQQSGVNNNNNGGDFVIQSGAAGTGGSGTAGRAGSVKLRADGTDALLVNYDATITFANYTAGLIRSDGSGNLSSSTVGNGDIPVNTISVNKLAAGTAGQFLQNNGTPTPTWTTMGGDVSIGNTGSVTVNKINGTTVSTAGGSLTTGKVLRVTGTSTSDWGAVDLANSSAVTGILPRGNQQDQNLGSDLSGTTGSATVSKIQGVTISGSAVTGYVLTATSSSAATWSAPTGGGGGAGDFNGFLLMGA